MSRAHIALGAAVAAVAVLALAPVASGAGDRAATEARAVATEFFRTINARQYEQTCDLLSAAYLERYQIPSKEHCAIGLRIGFMWSQEIRFRLTGVTVEPDRVVVRSLADGVRGRILLVREEGRLKILDIEGR